MSLTIIESKRRIRKFLVYDFEWVPGTLDIRLAGWYDGNKYHYAFDVDTFLNHALTSKNSGRWFYAHAGGLADVQFVFESLLKSKRYHVTASFSGSSAIIVHIKRGKNVWHFVDSYWLLRDKLANIAKSLGMEKTGPTDSMSQEEIKNWYATVPIEELIPYNENDCVVLWKAIWEFQNALLEIGGQLQMTIASTAMHLFRRKYLGRTVDTSEIVNEQSRLAYFASRVEVFDLSCESSYYYDINSSFPYAMTKTVPGELLQSHKAIPDRLLYEDGNPFLAKVRFSVPDSYLPPIPIRTDNRVFFPLGSWESWLSGIDIKLLLEQGGTIESVSEVMEFEAYNGLAMYATDIYNRRKQTSDSFIRIVYKYLLNSLYGKFAEREDKTTVHINPDRRVLERLSLDDLLMPGVWSESVIARVPHMHVPISVYITSMARKTLYDYLIDSEDFHYCDTDGFSTTREDMLVSKDLGGLKLEKKIDEGFFFHPKVYRINGEVLDKEGKWKKKTLVKAKGFSLGKGKEAVTKFESLVSGQDIEVERMIRLRENFKKGVVRPQEVTITKGLRHSLIPKRFIYPDGSTRPWHIGELVK